MLCNFTVGRATLAKPSHKMSRERTRMFHIYIWRETETEAEKTERHLKTERITGACLFKIKANKFLNCSSGNSFH